MHDDTARFELPPIMKMEDCERLHTFLVGAKDQNIEIDCSAVDRLSGLAGQMLAVARQSWPTNERQVAFSNRSDSFDQGVVLLGLSDLILPDQVPA